MQNQTVPTSDVLAMALANTEYSYQVPADAHYILFKLRAADTVLRMSYQSGTVATPTGAYMTIPAGASKELQFINTHTPLTIYFATAGTSQVLEIEYWK